MNGVQLNGKVHNYEKPVPGCLGRMVCLFDLTSNVAGHKMLTEKPHRDGSPLSRSRSDVSRMSSPMGDEMEDKVIVSELRKISSAKKSEGTPMKMLIAQEMSRDVESKCNSPNVVAKLMGLDALPQQQELPDLVSKRNHSRCYSRNSNPEVLTGFWQQEPDFSNRGINYDVPRYREQNETRDVYEIWQQSQRTNCLRDASPQKGRSRENTDEKNMALVRQKFMELKRLAMDEKLCKTKEFQDAVEVLNSNGDLFVKYLQEQNSLFSHHLGHSIRPPEETKRITVLKPSKLVCDDKYAASGKKSEKPMSKLTKMDKTKGWNSNHHGLSPTIPCWKPDDSSTQPTRIVVLKPNLGKTHDMKAVVSSTPSSPINLRDTSLFEEPVHNETDEARVRSKEIMHQIRETPTGHRRDETLLSSVFSNGYNGDESSFNRSEAEFVVENISDSEVVSPASRHSWDYVNRYSSPYSSSSFSRASCSPESSVCREAKKRLSERWAMMASNGSNQEHTHMRRSSSTLGEMLALSEIKKPERSEEDASSKIQGPRGSTSCLVSSTGNDECATESPRSLLRSKSVPVSSTIFGGGLNADASGSEVCKPGSPKDATNGKTTKSSFKGKVSSLFFLRNKKSGKESSVKSQTIDGARNEAAEIPGSPVLPGRTSDDTSKYKKYTFFREALSPTLESTSCSASPDLDGVSPQQGGLSVSKPVTSGIPGENQDQPSPISVLDPLFEEDDGAALGCSSSSNSVRNGKNLGSCLSKSNLIDKSPPIGSIARTLSWDECSAERVAPYPLKSQFPLLGTEEEEGEWSFLVESLLSVAGLDSVTQVSSHLCRWHSPESPLDPLLREKYIDLTAKEPLHEAKRRLLRSKRKLVFDCVNLALVDIVGLGSNFNSYTGTHDRLLDNASPLLADRVWARMKEWFSGEVRCVSSEEDGGDGTSLVERVVMKEVVGKGWLDSMRLEVDKIGKEIEGKLLEELVEESVHNWAGGR